MLKQKIKKAFAFLITASLSLSLSSCSLFPLEEEDLKLPLVEETVSSFKLYTVRTDSIVQEASAIGNFAAVGLSELSFGTAGTIASIKAGFGDKVKAGQVLAELNTVGDIERDIIIQESAVATAKENYESDPSNYNKNALQTAENKLNELKSNLNKARIVAPFDGSVSFLLESAGRNQKVSAGTVIFSVSSNSSMVVHAPTANYADFNVGMSVNCDYNGTTFSGTVVYTTDETPGSENEFGLTSGFKGVVVALSTIPSTATIGDTISISRIIEEKNGVLVVPKATVTEYDGKNIVFVWQDGIRVEREVEIGLTSSFFYEIISGLSAGEQITY